MTANTINPTIGDVNSLDSLSDKKVSEESFTANNNNPTTGNNAFNVNAVDSLIVSLCLSHL